MRLRPVLALTQLALTQLALIPTVAATLGLSALPMAAAAKPTLESSGRQLPRPPRRPPPNQSQPGGGLDDEAQSCMSSNIPLTALVPVSNPVYTASAHPSFLFYLPDSPGAVDYAEFILLNADEKERIYITRFTPTQAGLVSVSMPESAHLLEAGENYHWYLNLYCHGTPSIPSVNGWVQRTNNLDNNLDSNEEGTASTDLDNITLDRTNTDMPKIWYDAIAQTAITLATDDTPNRQALENWQRWLLAIGLEQIAELPLNDLQSNNQFNLQVIQSATD